MYESDSKSGFPLLSRPQAVTSPGGLYFQDLTGMKFRTQHLPGTITAANDNGLVYTCVLCFMVSCFDQFCNEKASCHTHCFDLKFIFEMSIVIWRGLCGRNKWCRLPLVGGGSRCSRKNNFILVYVLLPYNKTIFASLGSSISIV